MKYGITLCLAVVLLRTTAEAQARSPSLMTYPPSASQHNSLGFGWGTEGGTFFLKVLDGPTYAGLQGPKQLMLFELRDLFANAVSIDWAVATQPVQSSHLTLGGYFTMFRRPDGENHRSDARLEAGTGWLIARSPILFFYASASVGAYAFHLPASDGPDYTLFPSGGMQLWWEMQKVHSRLGLAGKLSLHTEMGFYLSLEGKWTFWE